MTVWLNGIQLFSNWVKIWMNVPKSIEIFVSGINQNWSQLAANPVLGSKLLAGLKVSGKSKAIFTISSPCWRFCDSACYWFKPSTYKTVWNSLSGLGRCFKGKTFWEVSWLSQESFEDFGHALIESVLGPAYPSITLDRHHYYGVPI